MLKIGVNDHDHTHSFYTVLMIRDLKRSISESPVPLCMNDQHPFQMKDFNQCYFRQNMFPFNNSQLINSWLNNQFDWLWLITLLFFSCFSDGLGCIMCGYNTKQILLQIRKNYWPKSRLLYYSSSIINNYIYHRVSNIFEAFVSVLGQKGFRKIQMIWM